MFIVIGKRTQVQSTMKCSFHALTLGVVLAIQCAGQGVTASMTWLAAPDCSSDDAVSGTSGGPGPTGQNSVMKRAASLASELPSGPERQIALQIVEELQSGDIPGFCLDPQTGEFAARIPAGIGPTGVVSETEFTDFRVALENQSDPEITYEITPQAAGSGYRYSYRVANRSGARGSVTGWGIVVSAEDSSLRMSHPLWQANSTGDLLGPVGIVSEDAPAGGIHPIPGLGGNVAGGKLVRWAASSAEMAIQPGKSLAAFTAISNYRPGWTTAYVGSGTGVALPDDDIPSVVKDGLEILMEPHNYYSSVLTFGPKFSPSVSKSWIAADWYSALHRMILTGRLSSSSRYIGGLLNALGTIAQSETDVALSVREKPSQGLEETVDKLVRMALGATSR